MTDNIDLIERIKSALENLSACPWLPDLTTHLANAGWRFVYRESGLTPSTYGTARAMERCPQAPRNVVAYLSNSCAVELLDSRLEIQYQDAGIGFYTEDEISSALRRVEDAIELIKRVPSLHFTVYALARSFHLIKLDDDDYDVSFSEPHIPFSIFISVPREQGSITSVRVAEAIVHEAMHLQLTLIERFLPLVWSGTREYYSPWRREFRNVQGMLHGLFVFCVVHRFLGALRSFCLARPEVIRHIDERRAQIHKQGCRVRIFQNSADLTEGGSLVARTLIAIMEKE
jgi:HEXXH motif-containing protein